MSFRTAIKAGSACALLLASFPVCSQEKAAAPTIDIVRVRHPATVICERGALDQAAEPQAPPEGKKWVVLVAQVTPPVEKYSTLTEEVVLIDAATNRHPAHGFVIIPGRTARFVLFEDKAKWGLGQVRKDTEGKPYAAFAVVEQEGKPNLRIEKKEPIQITFLFAIPVTEEKLQVQLGGSARVPMEPRAPGVRVLSSRFPATVGYGYGYPRGVVAQRPPEGEKWVVVEMLITPPMVNYSTPVADVVLLDAASKSYPASAFDFGSNHMSFTPMDGITGAGQGWIDEKGEMVAAVVESEGELHLYITKKLPCRVAFVFGVPAAEKRLQLRIAGSPRVSLLTSSAAPATKVPKKSP